MQWRYRTQPGDRQAVRMLVAATGFFSAEEVAVAVELVEDALARGENSDYRFVFADAPDGALTGYVCYGPIMPSSCDFDLYWIAVAPNSQRHGTGRALLHETERMAYAEGASTMFIDTAGRSQYASTRAFYERMGYRIHKVVSNFYAVGDDKVIYRKPI